MLEIQPIRYFADQGGVYHFVDMWEGLTPESRLVAYPKWSTAVKLYSYIPVLFIFDLLFEKGNGWIQNIGAVSQA